MGVIPFILCSSVVATRLLLLYRQLRQPPEHERHTSHVPLRSGVRLMRCGLGALVAAGLALLAPHPVLAADAMAPRAAEEPRPGRPAPEEPSRWYGWQTLSADGGAVLFIVGSVTLNGQQPRTLSSMLGYASLGTYLLGGPIIHVAHQNYGRGVGSLGMRLGGPILLGVVGASAEGCNGGEWCGLLGGLLGATVGLVTAVAVDAAVFSYDDAPAPEAASLSLRIGLNARGVVAFGTF